MLKATLAALAITLAATGSAATVSAQTDPAAASAPAQATSAEGTFERRSKRLEGGWKIVHRDGRTFIAFDDAFRAASGPDLKVFLSPTAYDAVTGNTAVAGSINIGELQSTRGSQEYEIPPGVNLEDFRSILIHCEEFAALWGGSDL